MDHRPEYQAHLEAAERKAAAARSENQRAEWQKIADGWRQLIDGLDGGVQAADRRLKSGQ